MAGALLVCALGDGPGGDTAVPAETELRALLRRHARHRGGYLHLTGRELVLREGLHRRSGLRRVRVGRRSLPDVLGPGRRGGSARPPVDALSRKFPIGDFADHFLLTYRAANRLSHGLSGRAHGALLYSAVRALVFVCLRRARTDGPNSEGVSRFDRDRRSRAGVSPLRAHREPEIRLRLEG